MANGSVLWNMGTNSSNGRLGGDGGTGRAHASAWTLRARWYRRHFEATESDSFLDEVALRPLRADRGKRQQAHEVLERSRQWQIRPEVSEPNPYVAVPALNDNPTGRPGACQDT